MARACAQTCRIPGGGFLGWKNSRPGRLLGAVRQTVRESGTENSQMRCWSSVGRLLKRWNSVSDGGGTLSLMMGRGSPN